MDKPNANELIRAALAARQRAVAPFKALTECHKDSIGIAVVAQAPGGPMPCGACRQLLSEYAPKAQVWVADSRVPDRLREFSVRELLPAAFLAVPLITDRDDAAIQSAEI